MSTSQWARVLIKDGLTMEVTEDQARQYIPCKAELTSPQNDWELSWKHCRLTGLHSEQISFNFKLLHGLLPVKDRLHHLTPATSPTCSLCTDAKKEDLEHSLLNCSYNGGVGLALLSTIHRYVVALTPKKPPFFNFLTSQNLWSYHWSSSLLQSCSKFGQEGQRK